MKRQAFIDKMDEAEEYLHTEYGGRFGLCWALRTNVSFDARLEFHKLFSPDWVGYPAYYYNVYNYSAKNLELRHLALSLFKEICLTEGYYKQFSYKRCV